MSLPAPFDRLVTRFEQAWRCRAISLKAASFAMVGVVNTLVDLGVFLVAYSVLAVPLIPANLLAWLVAVSGSYVMNHTSPSQPIREAAAIAGLRRLRRLWHRRGCHQYHRAGGSVPI